MVRTAAKTVAPLRLVQLAPVLVEVGISGAIFFGSFNFVELVTLKRSSVLLFVQKK